MDTCLIFRFVVKKKEKKIYEWFGPWELHYGVNCARMCVHLCFGHTPSQNYITITAIDFHLAKIFKKFTNSRMKKEKSHTQSRTFNLFANEEKCVGGFFISCEHKHMHTRFKCL